MYLDPKDDSMTVNEAVFASAVESRDEDFRENDEFEDDGSYMDDPTED